MGLYSVEEWSRLAAWWSWSYIILVVIGFPLFHFASVFFANSMEEAILILVTSSTIVTVGIKTFIFWSKNGTFTELLSVMKEIDEQIMLCEKYRVIDPIRKITDAMIKIFAIDCYSIYIVMVYQTIFLPLDEGVWLSTTLYPTKFLHLPAILIGGFVYEAIANLLLMTASFGIDLYGASLLYLCSGYTDILCERLTALTFNDHDENEQSSIVELCTMYLDILRLALQF